MSSAIDLSQLPVPDIIEQIPYEDILQELLDYYHDQAAVSEQLVESDPSYKVLETTAYRELLMRQRFNERAKQLFLAYAVGSNLDHLAALYALEREADESDSDFRRRVQLAPEGFSTAGPELGYVFNGLSAGSTPTNVDVISTEPGKIVVTYSYDENELSAQIKDISAISPARGDVTVSVLSREGDGVPSQAMLDLVDARLNHRHVRPLTDHVVVQAAEVIHYTCEVDLTLYAGPDGELVRQQAQANVERHTVLHHRLGHDITQSGITSKAHAGKSDVVQEAIARFILADGTQLDHLEIDDHQAAFCDGVTVTIVGRDV